MTDNSKANRWTVPSSLSINEYNSNGWKFGNASSFVFIDLNNQTFRTGYSLEFKITEFNYYFTVYVENASETRQYLSNNSSKKYDLNGSITSITVTAGDIIRLEYTSTGLKFYCNNTYIQSTSSGIGDTKVRLATSTSRSIRIKDFKIKPL